MAVNWKTSVTAAAGGAAAGAPAGPWGALIGAGMAGGASLLGGGGAKEAGMAAAGAGIEAKTGIPMPGLSGSMLGAQNRRQQESQYPGTNPWERLGAPQAAAGAIAQTKEHGKQQKELQSKELKTKIQVANIAAGAHVEAARTSVAPAVARAPSQIKQTQMQTKHEEIINKYAPQLLQAEINEKMWRSAGAAIWNAMTIAEKSDFGDTDIAKAGVRITGTAIVGTIASVAGRRFMALGRLMIPKGFGKAARRPGGKNTRPKAVPDPGVKKTGLREKAMQKTPTQGPFNKNPQRKMGKIGF